LSETIYSSTDFNDLRMPVYSLAMHAMHAAFPANSGTRSVMNAYYRLFTARLPFLYRAFFTRYLHTFCAIHAHLSITHDP